MMETTEATKAPRSMQEKRENYPIVYERFLSEVPDVLRDFLEEFEISDESDVYHGVFPGFCSFS